MIGAITAPRDDALDAEFDRGLQQLVGSSKLSDRRSGCRARRMSRCANAEWDLLGLFVGLNYAAQRERWRIAVRDRRIRRSQGSI